jgi:hypothetical protein
MSSEKEQFEETQAGDEQPETTLRQRLGLPERKFVDGPPPRPVDMKQLRAYYAGEVEQGIRDEILDLTIQYREWAEASSAVLLERLKMHREGGKGVD